MLIRRYSIQLFERTYQMKFRETRLLTNVIKSNDPVKIFIDEIFCLDHPFGQVNVCI